MRDFLREWRAGEVPRSLRELPLSRNLRILALGPHPDDFDAIGVTLKWLTDRGNPLNAGIVPTGSGIEEDYCPGFSLAQKAELRKEEQRKSLLFFGLPESRLTFLELSRDPDDQPLNSPENVDLMEAYLRDKLPDIIVLPHGNDTNAGHRAMYALFQQAANRLNPSPVTLLNRDPKTIAMRMDLYMPFDDNEADWKAELLRFHDSQQQRNLNTRGHGFDERILDCNRVIARELGTGAPFAEAFEAVLPNRDAAP